MRALIILGVAGLLAGCSPATQAVIDAGLAQGEQGIKAAKDREAIALKEGLCLMGVGAKNRVLTPAERDHVEGLCGGDESLTFEDLAAMGRAIDLLRQAEPETFQ